jgi:hypothetical protein
MPNYFLFLHENPESFANVSPEEIQRIIKRYSEWSDRMRSNGHLLRGEKLQDGTGRVLRGESTTDGPYTESKEVIGGLFEIQAVDYDEAVEVARTCPHLEYGVVEVRQVEPVH